MGKTDRKGKRATSPVLDTFSSDDSDQEHKGHKPEPAKSVKRRKTGEFRKSYKRKAPTHQRASSKAEAAEHLQSAGRKLVELVTEHSDEQKLKQLAAGLPVRHFNDKQALVGRLKAQFPMWHWQLREGFSLLLYGFGSKKALLETFAREELQDGAVVAVLGFHTSLTTKRILAAVTSKATGKPATGKGTAELLAMLAAVPEDRPIYVVLHNIDGPGLRSLEPQSLLSEMAACPAVHLVASVDHSCAPLLWDRPTAARFNWLWHDATTFAPYTTELLDMPPVLIGCSQETKKRSAGAVLRTIVQNSRAIFRVIAEQQAEDPDSEGLALPHLYRLCRERFLVPNESTLRTHLVEVKDHDLLRTRMSSEGQEVMFIPLEAEALQKVLQELEEMD